MTQANTHTADDQMLPPIQCTKTTRQPKTSPIYTKPRTQRHGSTPASQARSPPAPGTST
jgi:hypothetical protein